MPEMFTALSQIRYIPMEKKKPQRLYPDHVASDKTLMKGERGQRAGEIIIYFSCFCTTLGFHLKPLLGQGTHQARSSDTITIVVVSIQIHGGKHKSPETPEHYSTANLNQPVGINFGFNKVFSCILQ